MPETAPSFHDAPVCAPPAQSAPVASRASDAYAAKLKAIRRDLRDEYTQPHAKPWIVGFSGGKDSPLLLHLLVECLLSIAPDERRRRVVILSNDTQVESPVFQTFVDRLLGHLRDSLADLRLPIEVVKTTPRVDESFWVNLLGRGYPAPSPFFRWCTDRMKVRPTSRFIREQVRAAGEAMLLLGVRRAESAQRAKNLARHDAAANGRLTPHTDFKGCHVFTPIKDLTTEEVWIALLNSRPPRGGSYRDVVRLFQDAHSGECPCVTSTDDAPSCGTTSARFGCWVCTVSERENRPARATRLQRSATRRRKCDATSQKRTQTSKRELLRPSSAFAATPFRSPRSKFRACHANRLRELQVQIAAEKGNRVDNLRRFLALVDERRKSERAFAMPDQTRLPQ